VKGTMMFSGIVNPMRRRAAGTVFLVSGLLVVLLLIGCRDDEEVGAPLTPSNPTTAAEFTSRGWERFEVSNFSGALNDFNDAIFLDTTYGEAHTGHGWTRLSQATSLNSMRAAVGSFGNAMANGENGADVLAGRAAANLGSGEASLDAAVADARAALSADADYVFSHRTSFDSLDLHLIDAFANAAHGNFSDALVPADLVLESGIDEGNASTWVVDGTNYDSFTGAVLAHLHKLSEQFSG